MYSLLEYLLRTFVEFITNYLPVKVIRDDRGVPFLYRYHLFSLTNDGPGVCIHHFVKSDPDRGYHDHPWNNAMSFILAGRYEERILNLSNKKEYNVYQRRALTFNYLDGVHNFHRVMISENEDAWTLFFFGKRRKVWGMIGLDGVYKAMSRQVSDADGGWWRTVNDGRSLHEHTQHPGNVITTVDIIVIADGKVLLIERGKDPYKGYWAFPGGRIEEKDIDTISAAYRELKEETNLENVELEYFTTVGNNHRDPRGFCLTNVFMTRLSEIPSDVRAGDDAVNFAWFPLTDLPDMAFDHKQILQKSG